ncbi:DUF2752 domain-containing protein [Streptomyces sp. MS06]|uniref:DUF2752 domain-containing protein n=1 Tax=Streptomyces sp. MS06 TaxID=3385974 RepID=UPI0039A0A80D
MSEAAASGAERSGRWPPVRVEWDDRDRHRWVGPLAAVGLVAGAALALFGLPPVDLHTPLHYAGVMTPMCGATRGIHAALLGRLGDAWRYNPLSVVLVLGAAAALLREAVGRQRGRWVNLRLTHRPTAYVAGALLLVALEAHQQAHADLLRSGAAARPPAWLLLPIALPVTAAVTLLVLSLVRRAAVREQ